MASLESIYPSAKLSLPRSYFIRARKPSLAKGGTVSGPTSGYEATLHGTEAVVPLPDGRTIPVQYNGSSKSSGTGEQVALLTQELDKLDSLLSVMSKQNDITNRILMQQA